MHRDHHLRLEITRHRQPSHLRHLTIRYRADRHQDDVRMIKLLDQSHVAEDPGIALVVNRAAIRKLKHITDRPPRSEEHTSELQSLTNLVCRLLLEKKKNN